MSSFLLSRSSVLVQACSSARQPSASTSSAVRTLVNHAAGKPAPNPHSSDETPLTFLASLGRGLNTKIKEPYTENWKTLWTLNGHALKEAGLGVRDRRYALWCMEKYRQGEDPARFAHPPAPKKKIRGHGPAVQNGKRIRSRRKQ